MSKGKQRGKIYSLLCKLDGLNKVDIKSPLSSNEIEKYETSLFTKIDECMPATLYRYRPLSNREIDNYLNDRVYLNMPENFNDPADSVVYVNAIGITEYFRLAAGKNSVEDMLESEEELATILRLSNNAVDTIYSIRKKIKTACFSEDITSSLMWSHYSDYHKGFALSYDMSSVTIEECMKCENDFCCHRKGFPFFPVFYKEERCDISIYAIAKAYYYEVSGGDADDLPIPLLPLLEKSESWKYEKEWRLLCHNPDLDYVCMKANAIYLGSQIEYEYALKLIRIAREKKQLVYKMKIDYNDRTFALKYNDWSDWSDEEVEGWYYPNGKPEDIAE